MLGEIFEETKNVTPLKDFDFSFALKRAPVDNEGFIKAFNQNQLKEGKEFFSEFGFMVIENALTSQQCEDSINDIWEYLEQEKWRSSLAPKKLEVSRANPNTWWVENGWPSSLSSEGILGGPPVFTKQAIKVRMNKLLFEIGKLFYESDQIIISHDRYGLFRPTKKVSDGFKWMTDYNVHIDMNPWKYFDPLRMGGTTYSNNYFSGDDFTQEFNSTGHFTDGKAMKLQALYNFVDNREEDGGFHVIPGMHKQMLEWTKFTQDAEGSSYKNSSVDFIPLFWKSSFRLTAPLNKETFEGIGKYTQRVTARAGSLVVWSQFLPHGSAPNNSENIRMAQFMKIGMAEEIDMGSRMKRAKYVQKKLDNAEIKVEDEIERKMMGIDILVKDKERNE